MNKPRGGPLEFIVEEDPEGGYSARAVGENIFTQGEDVDDLKAMDSGCHRVPF